MDYPRPSCKNDNGVLIQVSPEHDDRMFFYCQIIEHYCINLSIAGSLSGSSENSVYLRPKSPHGYMKELMSCPPELAITIWPPLFPLPLPPRKTMFPLYKLSFGRDNLSDLFQLINRLVVRPQFRFVLT